MLSGEDSESVPKTLRVRIEDRWFTRDVDVVRACCQTRIDDWAVGVNVWPCTIEDNRSIFENRFEFIASVERNDSILKIELMCLFRHPFDVATHEQRPQTLVDRHACGCSPNISGASIKHEI